jgi:predicted transcriptional regulator
LVTATNETLVELTADIVSAHVTHNTVAVSDLAQLIQNVHAALANLGAAPKPAEPEKPKRPMSVRASIKNDHLISMIDGRQYKMLRRHLGLNGYTPESYRATFDLPADYPLVAPAYAEQRRTLAMKNGLGRKPAPPEPEPVPETPLPSKSRRTLKVKV